MRPTFPRRGGGQRYPFPKEVWSPSGGWWTQPLNWKTNTAVAFGGVAFICYLAFKFSCEYEHRIGDGPTRWIPSMMWTREGKEGKIKIREDFWDEQEGRKETPSSHH
ncbi:hypothetical protein BT69DRAFT_1345465 [Atractiella rhizophila]|nr:hypothetical protein BT69DRAFT_1346769 [Atractiella rhizophila]KAH8929923.1 hypothetical protein BT69DRAFT_1345465 [Atractiella rhizophila]